METFKPCFFDKRYKISNLGNIKKILSNGKERILKPSILNKGKTNPYYYIQIHQEGKRKNHLIHRLVAFAFIENDNPDYNIVDHIDRNTFNNNVDNLRWCNQKINMNNCIRNRTEEEQKETRRKAMRRRLVKVVCDCNRIVSKCNLSAHLKSNIHFESLINSTEFL